MHTNESAENYLETILILSKKRPVVRSVDIAAELNFKKSSVSVAMKKLRETETSPSPRKGISLSLHQGRRSRTGSMSGTHFSPHGWRDWELTRKSQQRMHAGSNM